MRCDGTGTSSARVRQSCCKLRREKTRVRRTTMPPTMERPRRKLTSQNNQLIFNLWKYYEDKRESDLAKWEQYYGSREPIELVSEAAGIPLNISKDSVRRIREALLKTQSAAISKHEEIPNGPPVKTEESAATDTEHIESRTNYGNAGPPRTWNEFTKESPYIFTYY